MKKKVKVREKSEPELRRIAFYVPQDVHTEIWDVKTHKARGLEFHQVASAIFLVGLRRVREQPDLFEKILQDEKLKEIRNPPSNRVLKG